MTNFVTKKDGTRVAFDGEKIKASIAAAAVDAEIADDEAEKIGESVGVLVIAGLENQEEVATSEIVEKVLLELEVSAPLVAEAWKKYDEIKEH